MGGFRIQRFEGDFAVCTGTGACLSGPLSREDAQTQMAVLTAAERARRASDPLVLMQRRTKAAYRLIERDPYLKVLKQFLPRKRAIQRSTQRAYKSSMEFVGDHMSIVASDPTVHAVLIRSPGQCRVSKATQANEQRGDAMRAQVAERWHALAELPERKRTARIAEDLHINVRHVRRLRPRSTSKNKKRTFRREGRFPRPVPAIPRS